MKLRARASVAIGRYPLTNAFVNCEVHTSGFSLSVRVQIRFPWELGVGSWELGRPDPGSLYREYSVGVTSPPSTCRDPQDDRFDCPAISAAGGQSSAATRMRQNVAEQRLLPTARNTRYARGRRGRAERDGAIQHAGSSASRPASTVRIEPNAAALPARDEERVPGRRRAT